MYVKHWDNTIKESDRLRLLELFSQVSTWQRSTVTHDGKGSYSNDVRTSETLFQNGMPSDATDYLRGFSKWLSHLTGRDSVRLEGWQAIRYSTKQEFQAHVDPVATDTNKREMTVLLTLQQPNDGGETYFPKLKYAVQPVNCRLLVWENLMPDGSINAFSLHAGLPVVKGEKIVLVNWFKQR